MAKFTKIKVEGFEELYPLAQLACLRVNSILENGERGERDVDDLTRDAIEDVNCGDFTIHYLMHAVPDDVQDAIEDGEGTLTGIVRFYVTNEIVEKCKITIMEDEEND